jgi:1,4-alpha-glucan branching enzyme
MPHKVAPGGLRSRAVCLRCSRVAWLGMRTRQYHLAEFGSDPYLAPFSDRLAQRRAYTEAIESRLLQACPSLAEFASGHEHFGLRREGDEWVFREWAPNATAIHLVGDFSNWQVDLSFSLKRRAHGEWERRWPADRLKHGQHFHMQVHWPGGSGTRLPAWSRRVVQDHHTKIFTAQVWDAEPYAWQQDFVAPKRPPLIYEAHVGMATEEDRVGTYLEFRDNVLPRVVQGGYNTLQLMAVMEHPYYGSFGYHVANFFASSSRFGTPEELKSLIDAAHAEGLAVIIDLVHSHCVKNEAEGLASLDGTRYQYFHAGPRGEHQAWDSLCFDYSKPEVMHFLLSNCRYWLDEFRVDGFRFDGITSMLYHHHGLGHTFTDYGQYFDWSIDPDAFAYLCLANKLIHELRPDAMSIAEDMSGMPGLAAPPEMGGAGFDYTLAMGMPDTWFKLVEKVRDEDWPMGHLWHELQNRRSDEQTITYVDCHDQAIVGSKTFIMHLIDSDIYSAMHRDSQSLRVDRGIALHKLARLATLGACGDGYLTFMGNEFGHPEWIDFPREGNNWSYHFARRQWSLADDPGLRYGQLAAWDREMLAAIAPHIAAKPPTHLLDHDQHKLLGFRRGPLVLLFNFHPQQSLADFAIPLPDGDYDLLLDSDAERFGGQARITSGQRFHARDGAGIRVYLPARTALVLIER